MEIRLRAWNSAERQMYYNVGINPHAEDYYAFDKGGAILDMYGSRPALMQHTGLQDKYGKGIYEGDILEIDWEIDGLKIGRVTYERGCFIAQSLTSKKYCHLRQWVAWTDEIDMVAVIGNVYENPELVPKEEINQ